MRRVLLSFFAVTLLGLLAGCKSGHWHGVCDCEYDDHCCSRQPWVNAGGPAGDFLHDPGPAPHAVTLPANGAQPLPSGPAPGL